MKILLSIICLCWLIHSFTDAIFTDICEDVKKLTGESGYLTTPNHPKKYQGNLDCNKTISPHLGKIIQFSFLKFELEESSTCRYDSITFTYGDEQYGPKCGSSIPPAFITDKPVTIQFKTDQDNGYTGFNISWQVIEATPTTSNVSSSTSSSNVSSSTPYTKETPTEQTSINIPIVIVISLISVMIIMGVIIGLYLHKVRRPIERQLTQNIAAAAVSQETSNPRERLELLHTINTDPSVSDRQTEPLYIEVNSGTINQSTGTYINEDHLYHTIQQPVDPTYMNVDYPYLVLDPET